MYVVPGPAAGGEGETPIPRQAGGIPASPAVCVCWVDEGRQEERQQRRRGGLHGEGGQREKRLERDVVVRTYRGDGHLSPGGGGGHVPSPHNENKATLK